MSKIIVEEKEIIIINQDNGEYINLTNMVENASAHIGNWMRNKDTIEYLGIWEKTKNGADFKPLEFEGIRKDAGSNSFTMTPKKWNDTVNGKCIYSKPGKSGGTFAHRDIAFHFAMWLSPAFHFALVTEFQRLKTEESERLNTGWDYRRFLAKTNYTIHTDAIKTYLIPDLTDDQAKYAYPNEADMLNVALFGLTAKQWKERNPDHAAQGLNMRDLADVHQLIVLSNLENNNAYLIGKGIPQGERLLELRKNAISQIKSLKNSPYTLAKIESPFKKKELFKIASKTESGNSVLDNAMSKALKGKSDSK